MLGRRDLLWTTHFLLEKRTTVGLHGALSWYVDRRGRSDRAGWARVMIHLTRQLYKIARQLGPDCLLVEHVTDLVARHFILYDTK